MQVLFPGELEFVELVFCRKRKNQKPREKPLEQDENQQQTQSTCGTRPELNQATLVGSQHCMQSLCTTLVRVKQTCILPIAPIATSGGNITGLAYVPPICI